MGGCLSTGGTAVSDAPRPSADSGKAVGGKSPTSTAVKAHGQQPGSRAGSAAGPAEKAVPLVPPRSQPQRQSQRSSDISRIPMHLLRAMDDFKEGVVLLDLSRPGWQVAFANGAFCASAAAPELLGVCGDQALTATCQPFFWEMFEEAAEGKEGSYGAAMNSLLAGRGFMLKVKLNKSGVAAALSALAAAKRATSSHSSSSRCSSSSEVGTPGSPAEQPGATLSILFRPTSSEEPLPQRSRFATCAATRISDSSAERESEGPHTPLFYFGMLQQLHQPHSSSHSQQQQQQQQAQPPRQAATALPPAQARPQEQLRHDGSAISSTDMARSGSAGLPRAQSDKAAAQMQSIPALYEQRPEVMSEVTLGPLIGTGAMGRCYRGMWQGGRVAVKIIDCWSGAQPSINWAELAAPGAAAPRPQDVPAVEAALVEALLARSLSHPHIVTTYCHGATTVRSDNMGQVHQQVWIVQEFCRGSFNDALKQGLLRKADGAPNMLAILLSAQEIAGALHYLHQRDVIHGDLSPTNVLLSGSVKDSRGWVCKLADFGLSKCGDVSNFCKRSSILGTVTHMSPELLSDGSLTKAADVWSFGILLLEAYSGRRAWTGYSTFQVLNAVISGRMPFDIPLDTPPALRSLITTCLRPEPSQRPTFAVVLEAMEALVQDLAGSGSRPPAAGSAVASEQAAAVAGAAAAAQQSAAPGQQQQQQQSMFGPPLKGPITADSQFVSPFANSIARAPSPGPSFSMGVSVAASVQASPFAAAASMPVQTSPFAAAASMPVQTSPFAAAASMPVQTSPFAAAASMPVQTSPFAAAASMPVQTSPFAAAASMPVQTSPFAAAASMPVQASPFAAAASMPV